MYNYDQLEKLYYKRKRKKYFIYFSILFILIIIVYFFYYVNNKIYKDKKHITNNIKSEINISKKNVNIIKSEHNLSKIKHNSIVKSEMNITKKVEKNVTKSDINLTKKSNKISKLSLNPMIPDVDIISIKVSEKNKNSIMSYTAHNITKPLKIKEPKIVIKVSKSKYSLKELLNNYKLFPEYETAIKIANIYFSQKKYDKCIEWAKKANNINPEDAESWLLYSKSLVKLGKNKEAKQLLDSYLKIYGSNQQIEKYVRSIK